MKGGKVFGSSLIVMAVVGRSRAGSNTEKRIRGIAKRGRLVNWTKFMVRFKRGFCG